ncbi:MAG: hypothetical protein L3J58_08480 [Emcibacter sp.]|nr:hypothetical protein [Emcibacter sp.]
MKVFSQLQAHLWAFYYKITIWLLLKKIKYGSIVGLLTLLSLIIISALLFPILNNVLETYFSIHGRLSSFQTLLMTLGGSLIGATAIAFSLIMFAMQVNVERMPHGLFRKFRGGTQI